MPEIITVPDWRNMEAYKNAIRAGADRVRDFNRKRRYKLALNRKLKRKRK